MHNTPERGNENEQSPLSLLNVITLTVNKGRIISSLNRLLSFRMTIRRRLFILLIALCVMTVSSLIFFGFLAKEKTTYLQTYGWSDPITIHGPIERATPPHISVTTTRRHTLLAWEKPVGEQEELGIARSTNQTWRTRDVTPVTTDINIQPDIKTSSDGSIYLAWRGKTSPAQTRSTGTYMSGVFWTRSTDLGETWQEPEPLTIFQANNSQEFTEPIYSKPRIYTTKDKVRIYYTSNQDPSHSWIWYRETRDNGTTWSPPQPVQGSTPYSELLVTTRQELLTLHRENNKTITLTKRQEDNREPYTTTIGQGWPTDLYQDRNNTIWALWHRKAPEKTTHTYILENGTKKETRYSQDQIWISSSQDQGETWTQPALLTTSTQTERMAKLVQTKNGTYIAIYTTYPTDTIAPWTQTWKWSIKTKHTQTKNIQIATVTRTKDR